MRNLKPSKLIMPLLIIWALFVLASCDAQKRLQRHCDKCPKETKDSIITNTITETKYDTITTPADSSWYNALLECKNGKVVIKDTTTKSGTTIAKKPKVTIKDNKLTVECVCDTAKIIHSYKQTNTVTEKFHTERIPKYIEKELTKLQGWYMKIGKFVFWALAVLLILLILDIIFNILSKAGVVSLPWMTPVKLFLNLFKKK